MTAPLGSPQELQAACRSLSRGDTEAARAGCLRLLRDYPQEAGAWHLLGLIAVLDGDPGAAEENLRRAAESPGAAGYYLLSYAELCLKHRDRAAALAMMRRALALDAAMPLGWLALGAQLLDAHEYGEAQACFERALRLDPGLWRARVQLALLLARSGRIGQADERFADLLREAGDDGDVLAQHAAYLQDLGRHEHAAAAIAQAIERSPESLDHQLRAADIDVELGRIEAALHRLESLAARHRNDPRWTASTAIVLRLLDRHEDAVALCRDALDRGAPSADLLRAHAQALWIGGRHDEAFAALDRAADWQPAPALSEKGALLSALGRFEEARLAFEQALRLAPAMAEAWYNKADAKTFAAGDPDIAAMRALLEAGCSHRDRMLLHFALGKACFETGAIDTAFAHWHAGNGMKRARIRYDADEAARALASIAAGHPGPAGVDPADVDPTDPRSSELPVFVVGMPRCGSSLVEQIIASHPQVHGGGEQMLLRELFAPLLEGGGHADEPRIADSALRILARQSTHAARIVDKDLMNFMHLGAIHRVFPRARIIHCRRDPLDTCFSAYTKLFAGDFPFAYDLRELGLHYRAYHALMAHWRATLPGRVFMDLDYESLVSNPEETTRRLVDFLGLPWNEACLRFFDTRRAVNTASQAQVRRPIYGSSVGRSTALQAHLIPLMRALGDLAGPALKSAASPAPAPVPPTDRHRTSSPRTSSAGVPRG